MARRVESAKKNHSLIRQTIQGESRSSLQESIGKIKTKKKSRLTTAISKELSQVKMKSGIKKRKYKQENSLLTGSFTYYENGSFTIFDNLNMKEFGELDSFDARLRIADCQEFHKLLMERQITF